MKFFFIKLIFFLSFFVILDLSIGFILNKMYLTVKSSKSYKSNYGFTNCNEDIVLLGASEVSHHLISNKITEKTNLSCFNFGMDGCGIFYQYPLFQSILKTKKPKILVLSFSQIFERKDREYLSELYPYYKNNEYVKQIIDSINPKESIKLNSYLYTFNSKLLEIIKGHLTKSETSNGYWPLYGSTSGLKLIDCPASLYSNETLYYFEQLLKTANLNGVSVYIFFAPRFEKFDNKKNKKIIDSLHKKYKFRFLDYTNDTDFILHPELFKDRGHLNDLGANILTDKLINELKI